MSVANLEDFNFPSDEISSEMANIALNNIQQGIMITNKHNQIIYVNQKFEDITGYTFNELKGKTPKKLQSGIQEFSFYEKMKKVVIQTGKWEGELWNRTKSGEVVLQSMTIIAIKNENNEIVNFIGVFSDILNNRTIQKEYLHHVTYYDLLTSLPNRFLFEKRVVASLKQSSQSKKPFAIIYFQLENFTEINQQHGFLFGDILLKRTATRLNNITSDTNLVTRWSGTEFAWIIENFNSLEVIKDEISNFDTHQLCPPHLQPLQNLHSP